MITFNASLASILFCMIAVSGLVLPSHHGALSSHQKYQDNPINVQTEERNNNAEMACISPDTNIYEIFHKAQKLAKGNDMKCHFYIHNKENYEYIGTLDINKQLFEELLMKYDHWLLTKLKTNNNVLKDVKDTVDNGYEAIDDKYIDDSRTYDDKKTSHHTTHHHKSHHTKDNHHRKEFDERKVKNKHYIELDPRYDETHKYFEVFLPKNKHKNEPRKIYINVDKDNKEFLLFDNEKHREMNYKPIKIGLRELSAIADVIFNKAEDGKTVFTVNDENIEEPERYEIKKVDYERVEDEDEKTVDIEPRTSKLNYLDVSDSENENDYTELNQTDFDDHDNTENDNTTNDLDVNNTDTNICNDLRHVENDNKQGIIDFKDTDNNNAEVYANNEVIENNDTESHNYDNGDDFNNDTTVQIEDNEDIDKATAKGTNNYIFHGEKYPIPSEDNSQQDNTEVIDFRRSQIEENDLRVKDNFAPAQDFNQRFDTTYKNQPATSNPCKVPNIQTNLPTPFTVKNILDNSRNYPLNLDFNSNVISLSDSAPCKIIETPCDSTLEELNLPNNIHPELLLPDSHLFAFRNAPCPSKVVERPCNFPKEELQLPIDCATNIAPELSLESNLYAFPNAPCPSSVNMPTQNDVKFDTVPSDLLNNGHNSPPCELSDVFNQKNIIPLQINANSPKSGLVCNQNGILPNMNKHGNYLNPFLQSAPCIPKEFSTKPCLLPNSYPLNPYASFGSRPISPLNHPNIKSNFLSNTFTYPQYLNQKRPCLPFSYTGQNPNYIAANFPSKLPSNYPCFTNKLIETPKKYKPYDIHLSADDDSSIDHTKYGYLTEMPSTKIPIRPSKPSFKLTMDNNQGFKSSDQSLLHSSLSKPDLSLPSSTFEEENRNFFEKSSPNSSNLDLDNSKFSPDSTNFKSVNVKPDKDIESLIKIISQTDNSMNGLGKTGLGEIAPEILDASLVGPGLDLNKSSGDLLSSTLAGSYIPSSSSSSIDSSLIGSSLNLNKSSTNLKPLDSSLIGQNLELNDTPENLMSTTLLGSNESPSNLNGINALGTEELGVKNALDSSLIGPGLSLDKASSNITPLGSNSDLNVLSGSYSSTNMSPTYANEIKTSTKELIPSTSLDASLIGQKLKLNNLMSNTLTNTNVLSSDLNELNKLGNQGLEVLNPLDTSLIGPGLNIDRTSVFTTQEGITTPFSTKGEIQFSTQNESPSLVLDSSLIGPSLKTLTSKLELDNRVQISDENDTTNPLMVHNDNDNSNIVEDNVPKSLKDDTLGDIDERLALKEDTANIRNEDLPKSVKTNTTTSIVNTDNDFNINETKLPADTVEPNVDMKDKLPIERDESNTINVDLSHTETQIDNPINIINTTNEGNQPTDVPQTDLELNPTAKGGESYGNVEIQEPTAATPNGTSDLEKNAIDSGSHEEINMNEDALNAIISENNITLEPREHVKLIDVTNTTDNDSKLDENPDDYVVLYTTNMKDGNLVTQRDATVNSNRSLGNPVKDINMTKQEIVNNDMNVSPIPAEIMANPSNVEEAHRPAIDTQEMLMNDVKPLNEVMNNESYTDVNKDTYPVTNEDTNVDKNFLTQESRSAEPNNEITVLDSSLIGPRLGLTKETALNLIGGKVDSSLTGPSLFQELSRTANLPVTTVNNISNRPLTSASLFQNQFKQMNPTININKNLDSYLIGPGLNLDTDDNLGKNIGEDRFNVGTGEGLANNIVNDRFLAHSLINPSLPVELDNSLANYEDSSKLQHAILSLLNSGDTMDSSSIGADLLTLSKNAEKPLSFEETPEFDETKLSPLDSFGNKNNYKLSIDQSIPSMPFQYTPSYLGIGLPFDWTSSSMKPCVPSTPLIPYSYSSSPTPAEYTPSSIGLGLPFGWTSSSLKPYISSTPMLPYPALSSPTPTEYAPPTLGIGTPFNWTASSMEPSISSTPMSPYTYSSRPPPLEYAPSSIGLGLPFYRATSSMEPFISSTPMSPYSYSSSPTPMEYAPSTLGIGTPFNWTASSMKPSISSTPMSPHTYSSSPTPIEYAPLTLGIGLPFDFTVPSIKPCVLSTPILPYSYSPSPTSMEYAPSTFGLGLPFDCTVPSVRPSASSTSMSPHSPLPRPPYSNILPSSYPSPSYLNVPYTPPNTRNEYQSPLLQVPKPYNTAMSPSQNYPNAFTPKPSPSIYFNPILSDNTLPTISESNPFLPSYYKPISTSNPFPNNPLSPLSLVKPSETSTLPSKSLLKDNSFTNSKPYVTPLMSSLPSDLIRPSPSESSLTYDSKPYITNNNNMLPLTPRPITNMIPTISLLPSFIPKPCINNNNFIPSSQNLSPISNPIASLDIQRPTINNLINNVSPLHEEKPLHFLPQYLSFLDQEHPCIKSIKLGSSPMQASYPQYLSKSFSDLEKPPFTSILNSSPSNNIKLLRQPTTPSSPISSLTQMDSPLNKWAIPLPTTSVQNFAIPYSPTPDFSKKSTRLLENQPFFQIPSNIPINIPFSEWNSLAPREYIPSLSKPKFSMSSFTPESSITDSAKEPLLLNEIKSIFDKSKTDLSRDAYPTNTLPLNTPDSLSTSNLNSKLLQTEFKLQSTTPLSSINQIVPCLSTNSMYFDDKLKTSPEYLDSTLPDNMPEDIEVIQNKIPNLQSKELNNYPIIDKEAVDEIARLLERDKQSRSIPNFDTNVITGVKEPMYSESSDNYEPYVIDDRRPIAMASPMPFVEPILRANNLMYNLAPADFKPYATYDKAPILIPRPVPCTDHFNFPTSILAPFKSELSATNDKTPILMSSPSFARPIESPFANSFMAPFLQGPPMALPFTSQSRPVTSTLPTKPSSFSSTHPIPSEFIPCPPEIETKLASLPTLSDLPSEFSPSSPLIESKFPSLTPSNELLSSKSSSVPLSESSESYSSIPDNIETFSMETQNLPNSQLIPLSLVKSQTEAIPPTTKNENTVPKPDNFKWSDIDLDKFEPYEEGTEPKLPKADNDEADRRFYYSNDLFDKYHERPFIIEPEELNYIENENDLKPSAPLNRNAFSEAVSTKPLTPHMNLDNLPTETKASSINQPTALIKTLPAPSLEPLSLAPPISMLDKVSTFKISPICEYPSSSSSTAPESPLPSLLKKDSYFPSISSFNYNTPCLSSNLIKPCLKLPIHNTPTSLYATIPKSSLSSPNTVSLPHNLTPSALHSKYEPYTLDHKTPISTTAVPFINPILETLNSPYGMDNLRQVDFKPYTTVDKIPISMPKSIPCARPSFEVKSFNPSNLMSTPIKYEPYVTDYRTPISMPNSLSSPNAASLPTGSFIPYLPKPPSNFSSSPTPFTNVPRSLATSSPNTLQYALPAIPYQSLPIPSNSIPSLTIPSSLINEYPALPCAQYESKPYVSVDKVLNPSPSIISYVSSVPNTLPLISSSQIKENPALPCASYESKPCISVNKVSNPSSSIVPCTVLSLPSDSSMPSSTRGFESPKLPCITIAPLLPASEIPSSSIPFSFNPKLTSVSPCITPVSTTPTLTVSQLPFLPNPLLTSIEASTFTPNYASKSLPILPLVSSVRPIDNKPSFTSFIESPFLSQMPSKPEMPSKPVSSSPTALPSPFIQSLSVPPNLNAPLSKIPSIMTPVCQNMPSMSSQPLISLAPSPKLDINRNYAPKPYTVNKNLNILSPNEYLPFELDLKDDFSAPSVKNPFINSVQPNYKFSSPMGTSPKLPLSKVLNPFINTVKPNPYPCTSTVQTSPLISTTPSLHTSKLPYIIEKPNENTQIKNNQQNLPFLTKPSRLIPSNPFLYSPKSPYFTDIPIENKPTSTTTKTYAQNLPFVYNIPSQSTPCTKSLIPRTESLINSPFINPISSPPELLTSGLSTNISPIEVPSSTFIPSPLPSYNLIKPPSAKPYQPPSIHINVPEYTPTNSLTNTPINTTPISPKPLPICITTQHLPTFEPTIGPNSQAYSPTQTLSSTMPLSNTNPLYLTPELLQSPTPNTHSVSIKSPTVSQTQSPPPCMPLFSNLLSPVADKTIVCPQPITNLPCTTVEPTPILSSSLKSPCMQETAIQSPILSQTLNLVLSGTKPPTTSPPSLYQSLIPTSSSQSPAVSMNLPLLPYYQPLTSFLSSPKSPDKSFNFPPLHYLNPLSDVPENTAHYLTTSNPKATQYPPFILTPQNQTPTPQNASNSQPCIQTTPPRKEKNPITPVEFLPDPRFKEKEDLITLDDLNNLPNELKSYNYKPFIIEENMTELGKNLEIEQRKFDNNNLYKEKESLHDIINDNINDDEHLEDINNTDKRTQAYDTNYLINNNYIAREPIKTTTYDPTQKENRIDALDLTSKPIKYQNFIPESEINNQENNPESLKEVKYYVDEIQHPEISNTNPLIHDKSPNDYDKDQFGIQNRPNLILGQFNPDNSDLKSPEMDYFNEIPNDFKYSGYKSYQMPSTDLRNKPPLIFNPSNTNSDSNTDFNYNQPELNLNNQNLSPKLTNTNCLKDILIKYIKENNISNLNDEISIPVGNIAFIDHEDKPITDSIDMKDSDLNLKMWKSNIKIVNAEIKLKCKEITVNNFMPIQKPDSFDDYRDIVKKYIEDKYGHCIIMDKPYTKETRYSVLKDFEPSAVGYNFNLLWPTHYA